MPSMETEPVRAASRPTMREVAALAGVSLKTVSRVVNGVSTVDPVLVARVRDAAGKLGYRPNLTASSLRRSDGRTATIGMLVEDAANPFSAALMRTVENVARDRRVLVLFSSLDEDNAREREVTGALIDRRVDGLLIVPAGRDHSYLIKERAAGTCLVFLDREPRWAPEGDAIYFLSERDGFRCLWAQRLEPATKKPHGNPFPVFHAHSALLSLNVGNDTHLSGLTVAGDKIYLTMAESTGNLWFASWAR